MDVWIVLVMQLTSNISILKSAYLGKTGAIVGSGPSIINLIHDSFLGVDVVITIDYAIARIRMLNLSMPIYTMWKDHGPLKGTPDGVCNPCPGQPPCTNRCIKLSPQSPEIYVVHVHESEHCNEQYSPRYIFDNNQFGHHWGKPSVVPSIEIMRLFGVVDLKMMGFDSITSGSKQTCRDGLTAISLLDGCAYPAHALIIKDLLSRCTFKSVEFIK